MYACMYVCMNLCLILNILTLYATEKQKFVIKFSNFGRLFLFSTSRSFLKVNSLSVEATMETLHSPLR